MNPHKSRDNVYAPSGQAAITKPVEFGALAPRPDLMQLLLADKRSEATRRAYKGDLRDFFGHDPGPEDVRAFLDLPPHEVALRLAGYKEDLRARSMSEATINRRLSAVRSLLKFSFRLGLSRTDGRGLIDGERQTAYRDTRGISPAQSRAILALPDRSTIRGLRDYALLRLLLENVLRRGEIARLDVADFFLQQKTLYILGKGRGTQREPVTLSASGAAAIGAYLLAAGHALDRTGPLFQNVSRNTAHKGGRITGHAIYLIVLGYGARIGIDPEGLKRLTPHKLRHTGITAALDATKGDYRKVQKLSRHREIKTIMIYDDNRENLQGGVTDLLEKMYE